MGPKDRSGLTYRGNLYYDSSSGQFTQQDPIGIAGGINLYGYAKGDPINFSDPFGLSPCWIYAPEKCTGRVAETVRQVTGAVGDFLGNYRAMVEADTIGADQYYHCMANCEASRRGPIGRKTAEILSDVREFVDQLRGDPPEASIQDQEANELGREGGTEQPQLLCEEICEVNRPEGLLDF